jgi:hypothetical protein
MEIKNVSDNPKKLKIALKQFLYTNLFCTLEAYFIQSQIMYCITQTAYYIGISWRFCLNGHCISIHWLYNTIWTVYYDLNSNPCISLMSSLCIVFIKLFVFYCHDSFFTLLIDILRGHLVAQLVEALRGFDSRWCQIFSLT